MPTRFKVALGIAAMLFLLALIGVWAGWTKLVHVDRTSTSTECIARQLAAPWVGLRESFSAPPGDPVARAAALKAIKHGIAQLRNLERYCPSG